MAAIMRGKRAAIVAEQDRLRMAAYELARWVAFAFHDPKKMPQFQTLAQARQGASVAQALVDDAKVRGWFIKMSMRKH